MTKKKKNFQILFKIQYWSVYLNFRDPEEANIKDEVSYTTSETHSNEVEVQTSDTAPLAAVVLLCIPI